jgi:LPXTG-motif cell wall-anchored protein
MKRRMTSATLVAAMLLLGSFAIPASAQEVGDEFDGVTAEVCAEAIAAAYGVAESPVFDQFAEFFADGTIESDVVDEQGLIDAVVAFLATQGQTLEDTCGIYIEAAPIVIEDDPEPEPVPEPEVAGVTLTQTGANTGLLALGGLLLLALGVVAVRRTRSEVGAR